MDEDDVIAVMFLCGVVFVVFLLGFSMFYNVGMQPGEGRQIGYIAEVEKAGLIWQPETVVLIGSEATFSDSQTSWTYGVMSHEMTEKAINYLDTHEKVVVHYKTEFLVERWDSPSATRITEISPAKVV